MQIAGAFGLKILESSVRVKPQRGIFDQILHPIQKNVAGVQPEIPNLFDDVFSIHKRRHIRSLHDFQNFIRRITQAQQGRNDRARRGACHAFDIRQNALTFKLLNGSDIHQTFYAAALKD